MTSEDEPQGTVATKPPPAAATGEAQAPNASEVVASLGIAETVKQSFVDYIADKNVVAKGDNPQLNLDWEFIRDHGGPLLAHMFQRVTKQLLPENLRFSVPAPKAPTTTPDEAATGEPQAGPKQGVDINFDLGDFLGKIFRGPQDDTKPR